MKLIGANDVPRKVSLKGDRDSATEQIGYAEKLLIDLEERVSRSSSGIWHDSITKEIPGGYVTCQTTLHLVTRRPIFQSIEIFVRPSGRKDRPKDYECPCNCNFSRGTVVEVEPATTERPYQVMQVAICHDEKWYVLYENVIGSDFTPWEVGMPVVVMAYHDFLFDCCNAAFNSTGCQPIEDMDNEAHSSDWRSAVRILPFDPDLEKIREQVP